jgi:hypothetical protein
VNRTCNQCGWVAFGVTRELAETQVARFNKFYLAQPPAVQHCYSGPSSIAHYECCTRCGNEHENFRDSVEGDCPDGCTISPIIVEHVYPAPAVTGYEVAPPSGVEISFGLEVQRLEPFPVKPVIF